MTSLIRTNMNRIIVVGVVLTALLGTFPSQAEAQFLKKLGKVLENADKVLASGSAAARRPAASAGTGAADGMQVVNNLKGFEVEFKGVTWQKDFCGLEFVVTNTGSSTQRVYAFDKMKTFGADGTQYDSRSIVGNSVTSLGNGDFDFEPGVPVKCVYALFGLPESGTVMSLCQLRLTMFENGYQDRFVEFRNVPVPARHSNPFKGVWKLEGTGLEGKLVLDFYGKSVDGMDALNNAVKCYGTIYVGYGSGASMKVDECSITSWEDNGNTPLVNFIGGRDGNTYEARMIYDPQKETVRFSDIRIVAEEGMAECFVSDDLVFGK